MSTIPGDLPEREFPDVTKEMLETKIDDYLTSCVREQIAARTSEMAFFLEIRRRLLDRMMREVLGMSAKKALSLSQMKLACRLLRETTLDIIDVGRQCGFRIGDNFSATFKRKIGVTPSDYRMGVSSPIAAFADPQPADI